MTSTRLWISLLLNAFVFLSVLLCVRAFFVRGGKGNMQAVGTHALIFFTVQSNLLCALSCLALCVWEGIALARGGGALLPRWLDLFKFTGTCAVGLTFFTVIFYLLPITHFDFHMMYDGRNLLLHGLCPLAAMVSWTFLEQGQPLAFGWVLLGLVPTALYGLLYFHMVLRLQRWKDFYRFNEGGKWPVSFAAMGVFTFAISAALWALRG